MNLSVLAAEERKRNFEVGEQILLQLGEEGMGKAYTKLAKAKISLEDHLDFEGAALLLKKALVLGDKEALKILETHPDRILRRAEEGDKEAQRQMGGVFLYGKWGIKRDLRSAVRWYERGAPDVWAEVQLGKIFRGVFEGFAGVDHEKAVAWFHKAEEKASGKACFYLALHYANGDGVKQDRQKANYYADGALKYWITGSLELNLTLMVASLDERTVNPRKDAIVGRRRLMPSLGSGDRF